MMQTNKQKMVFLVMLSIYTPTSAFAQVGSQHLPELVELSARRLVIAEQVALAKWDNGMPVEDASREDLIISRATKTGLSRGLDPTSVSNFFRAQIEANKLVQYSLLADWRREGRAPDHSPVDLYHTIRAKLDDVDKELIAELAESRVMRGSAACPSDIAKAVRKYTSAHTKQISPLTAIALDRALATACIASSRSSPTVFPRTGAASRRAPQKIGTSEAGGAPPATEIDLLKAPGFAFADLAMECDCHLASSR
jgi:chorismate mutase